MVEERRATLLRRMMPHHLAVFKDAVQALVASSGDGNPQLEQQNGKTGYVIDNRRRKCSDGRAKRTGGFFGETPDANPPTVTVNRDVTKKHGPGDGRALKRFRFPTSK